MEEMDDLLRAFKSRWMGGASSMPNGESTGENEHVSFIRPLTKSIWIFHAAV
jgi:hypothetical protein